MIEAGKFYKTYDGHKVGPLKWNPNSNMWSNGIHLWFSGGNWCQSGVRHSLDLVELWPDEGPVRTVTRKEIVPGTYGRVFVDGATNGKVGIKVNRERIWSDFSPPELRAAAATFIELADALDEVAA